MMKQLALTLALGLTLMTTAAAMDSDADINEAHALDLTKAVKEDPGTTAAPELPPEISCPPTVIGPQENGAGQRTPAYVGSSCPSGCNINPLNCLTSFCTEGNCMAIPVVGFECALLVGFVCQCPPPNS